MAEPIREILKVHIDPEANPTVMTKTLRGNFGGFPIETAILHPEGVMVVEDLFAGDTVEHWPFSHAEFHYVLKGKAELTYSLPPWHDEEKTLTVVAGDAYLIPNGADVTFKIAHGEPYRHIAIAMPFLSSYFEVAPKNRIELK